jgi:hypothetical protein
MVLDETAINNLKILSKYNKKNDLLTIKNKKQIFVHEKESDYESVNSISDLEYPIYFSFNHLFTMYKKTNHNRSELLFLMDDALSNIYLQFEDIVDYKNYIDTMHVLYQIDNVLTTITSRYYRYKCIYNINDQFDNYYQFFQDFLIEYKRNYTHYYYPLSSDSEDEEEEEEDKIVQTNKFEYIMNWLYNTSTDTIVKDE